METFKDEFKLNCIIQTEKSKELKEEQDAGKEKTPGAKEQTSQSDKGNFFETAVKNVLFKKIQVYIQPYQNKMYWFKNPIPVFSVKEWSSTSPSTLAQNLRDLSSRLLAPSPTGFLKRNIRLAPSFDAYNKERSDDQTGDKAGETGGAQDGDMSAGKSGIGF